jgi:methylphosphotriester-DNA--protein-cysteine methyltransferase
VSRTWTLTGPDGAHPSSRPGTLGGHRGTRIYGRLDCRTALRAIERGGYVAHRVFFASEKDAVAAGYRPCAVCMPEQFARWKQERA